MSTVALVAACGFNAEEFQRLDALDTFDQVFAVDAGFAALADIGRAPDVAIGDFDSLGYVPKCKRVVRYPAHKDKSDLELALDRAQTRHFDEVYVFGALGGRLDHTVANMQLFARYAEAEMYLTAIADTYALHVLVGPDAFDLPPYRKGVVSVFSATPESHGVLERGMEYSLDDETLTNRTSRGLSNELCGREAAVAVEEGTLLVFYPLSDAAGAEDESDV